MTPRPQSGFTLIELTMVLVIAGLLFAISVPNFEKLSETRDYRKAVRQVVSAANSARITSIHRNQSVDLVVDAEQRLLSVRSLGASAEKSDAIVLPDTLEVSVTAAAELSPDSGVSVIRFYPSGGSSGGDIELLTGQGSGTLIQIGWLLADVRQSTI